MYAERDGSRDRLYGGGGDQHLRSSLPQQPQQYYYENHQSPAPPRRASAYAAPPRWDNADTVRPRSRVGNAPPNRRGSVNVRRTSVIGGDGARRGSAYDGRRSVGGYDPRRSAGGYDPRRSAGGGGGDVVSDWLRTGVGGDARSVDARSVDARSVASKGQRSVASKGQRSVASKGRRRGSVVGARRTSMVADAVDIRRGSIGGASRKQEEFDERASLGTGNRVHPDGRRRSVQADGGPRRASLDLRQSVQADGGPRRTSLDLRQSVGSEAGRSFVDSDFSDAESMYSSDELYDRQNHLIRPIRTKGLTKDDDRDTINNMIQQHRQVLAQSTDPPNKRKSLEKVNPRGSLQTGTTETLTDSSFYDSWRTDVTQKNIGSRRQTICLIMTTLILSLVAATFLQDGNIGRTISDWALDRMRGSNNEANTNGDEKSTSKNYRDGNYYDDGSREEPWRDLDKVRIVLPPELEHAFSDVDHEVPTGVSIIPFFWKIPKSGGNVVSLVMSKCLRMVEASDAGKGHDGETTLQVYANTRITKNGPLQTLHVNVDTSTVQGIERAKDIRLVPSGLADFIVSTFVYEVASLFDSPGHEGRAIALIRHPVHRAEGIYRSMAASETMDISEYFSPGSRQYVEDNWMVRTLSGQVMVGADGSLTVVPSDENTKNRHLTHDDLLLAMEVLRRKFVVGLVEDVEGSMRRFRQYFGWTSVDPNVDTSDGTEAVDQCVSVLTKPSGGVKSNGTRLTEGSPDWNIILTYNKWDIQLYEYAKILYEEQRNMMMKRS